MSKHTMSSNLRWHFTRYEACSENPFDHRDETYIRFAYVGRQKFTETTVLKHADLLEVLDIICCILMNPVDQPNGDIQARRRRQLPNQTR